MDSGQDNKMIVGDMRAHRLKAFLDSLKKHPKKALLITLILVLLIAGPAVVWKLKNKDKSPNKNTDTSQNQKTGLDYEAAYIEENLKDKNYTAEYGDYLIVGHAYLQKQDYDKAIEYYRKADALKADNFDTWYALATVYRLRKDKQQSLDYYAKVITEASKTDNPYNVNLQTYKAEQEAVQKGDYELKTVTGAQSNVPL